MSRRSIRWISVLVALGAAAVLAWQMLAPRGFVRISGEVAGQRVSDLARLDYGGQRDSQNYIRLRRRGYVAFFGSTRAPEGSRYLSRSAGNPGVWHCGRVQSATYGFREGSLHAVDVTEILDEGSAPREGTLAFSAFGGERRQCPSAVEVTGVVEGEFASTGYSSDEALTELDKSFVRDGEALEVYVELSPSREGEPTREVEFAWVRHVTYGEATVHRVYVAGPGSRYTKGECPRLELAELTAPGVCQLGPGDGELKITW